MEGVNSRAATLLVMFLLAAYIVACTCEEPASRAAQSSSNTLASSKVPDDTLENRKAAAASVIAVYSDAEWKDDVITRLKFQVGNDATEQVLQKIRAAVDQKQIADTRIKLLTDNFSVAELNKLAGVLSDPHGKTLVRKMSNHDDQLKALLAPIVMQVLSNELEPAK